MIRSNLEVSDFYRTHFTVRRSILSRSSTLIFGVILPLGVILFEWFTGFCAKTFFNPIPTIWHALLALLVPASNLLTWIMLDRPVRHRGWIGLVNAMGIGAAFYFVIVFAQITPIAVLAILAIGLGLLPLSPLFSMIVAIAQRWSLRGWTDDMQRRPVPGLITGLALAALCVVAVQAPVTLTNIGLSLAGSNSAQDQARGLNILRHFANSDQLLLSCYLPAQRRVDEFSRGLGFGSDVSPEAARGVFYRVTGQSFQSLPRPTLMFQRSSRIDDEIWRWDSDLGSDRIGVRIPKLALVDSRLDGVVEGDAGLAYLEWILVLQNDDPWAQREARAHIALPHGAVVTRCTLWINGDEHEAAFGERSQVKQAYQQVAIQQRRDPLLVTTAGQDRVLVQCFPIPPQGGQMKIRIGVTVPLAVQSLDRESLRLPVLLERNFGVAPELKHGVWLSGTNSMKTSGGKLIGETDAKGAQVLRGELDEASLSAEPIIEVSRANEVKFVSTDEAVAGQKRRIVQELVSNDSTTLPSAIVFAVDLSKLMHSHFGQFGKMLELLPQGTQVAVYGAADQMIDVTNGLKPLDADLVARIVKSLQANACSGGADNVPALSAAWEQAVKSGASVVWVHGPQPYLYEQTEILLQRFQRNSNVPIVSLNFVRGPNRLLEVLGDYVHSFPTDMQDTGLIRTALLKPPLQNVRRELREDEPLPVGARSASNHLARLWAADQVATQLRSSQTGARKAAVALATSYQLVTSVTGAVVLETSQQYAANKLQPVDSDSVPTTPEPSTLGLLLLSTGYLALRRPKRRGIEN